MLIEVLKQDKFLTAVLIIIGIMWIIVFLRNMRSINKKSGEFRQMYENILNADEYKVKGRFEE